MRALFFALMFSGTAYTKCITDIYVLSGVITSENEYVIDDAEIRITYIDWNGREKADTQKSNNLGEYQFEIKFYTYAGYAGARHIGRGYLCTLKLLNINVQIKANGYTEIKQRLDISNKHIKFNKSLKLIAKSEGLNPSV